MVTLLDPREASSDPVPFARGQAWRVLGCGLLALAAFTRSSVPAPCALVSATGSFCAVPTRSALTWSGDRLGRWSRSSAAAPETTAEACDVPLPLNRRSPRRAAGYIWSRTDPGARSPMTEAPGATRSGLRLPSPVLDHDGTTSSMTSYVPRLSEPPTAMTYGSYAGLFSFAVP